MPRVFQKWGVTHQKATYPYHVAFHQTVNDYWLLLTPAVAHQMIAACLPLPACFLLYAICLQMGSSIIDGSRKDFGSLVKSTYKYNEQGKSFKSRDFCSSHESSEDEFLNSIS
jgi:hypothetical protein